MRKKNNNIDINSLDLQDNKVRGMLFIQYQPLMYKIVNQFDGNLPLDRDDIISAAMEGFTLALNKWKPGTSQSFQQYAAWSMRNSILNSSNQEGHTVKFSAYQQKKAKEEGRSTFNTVRINSMLSDGDDDGSDRMIELGVEQPEMDLETNDSVFWQFYEWMSERFSQRDCHIFYHTYGVHGYELLKGTEIAEMFNISAASVSVTNKKIIKEIRNDNNIMSLLADLLK